MRNTPEIERLRRAKNTATARRRARAIASGDWVPPFVDPGPARDHITHLGTYGLAPATVAHLAGLHHTVVEKVANGHRRKIRRETEEAILRARFDLDRLEGRHRVSAVGTHRRLWALVRIGYSFTDLGRLLGVSKNRVGQYATAQALRASTARKVRDLYVRLYLTLGPSPRAADWAASAGWAPPWAWDDDTMDHPDTLPDFASLRPHGHHARPSEDTVEDVQWILAHEDSAATMEHVAHRLGVTKDAITRALTRAGEQRVRRLRDLFIGFDLEGPLREEDAAEVAEVLRPLQEIRERFYANTEAAGRQVTVRAAS